MARAEPAAWQRDRACRLYDWEGAGGVACAGERDMAAGDGCHGPAPGRVRPMVAWLLNSVTDSRKDESIIMI